ncbi:Tubulin_tyrosine ligase-like 2 [Hexamita inflata]|uniref:Tubulin--tyrosine ligase-like protein 9 n=1 Tax=Hexamita inflata TaxID=28002 RepID=A0AA86NI53_9EUKA|nr:Tubulin tyrosine ligase-like 2 [Hexamita inflata]
METAEPKTFFTDMNDSASRAIQEQGYTQATVEKAGLVWLSTEAFPKYLIDNFNRFAVDKSFRVNHVGNSYELTRKDLLARNIQKAQRYLQKSKSALNFDFIPKTFVLPQGQSLVLSHFGESDQLIVKPCGYAQGRGIFVCSVQQLKAWLQADYKQIQAENEPGSYHAIYLVQQYVVNPLLLYNRKFDLRIYVLLTPSALFVSHFSFGRFCRLDFDLSNEDEQAHLTNACINHLKLNTVNIKSALSSIYSKTQINALSHDIIELLVHTVSASLFELNFKPQMFELFGFDVLITDKLQPVLMEVNSSPSLQFDNEEDLNLKKKVVHDCLNVNQSFLKVFEFKKQKGIGEGFEKFVQEGKVNEEKWMEFGDNMGRAWE